MKANAACRTAVLLVFGLAGFTSCPAAEPLGTACSYRGSLVDAGMPAEGNYDLRFTVHDAASGGSTVAGRLKLAVSVSRGFFTTTLDFGDAVFTGSARWLEIGVRTNGGPAEFTVLTPRQPILPVPYALFSPYAHRASAATTVLANGVTASSIQDAAITASKIAGEQVVKSLNGLTDAVWLVAGTNITLTATDNTLQIAASVGPAEGGWQRTGNAIAPGEFLGTVNAEPLELHVNGLRALRLEPAGDSFDDGSLPDGAPNVIAGAPVNFVASGVAGASIGGGGAVDLGGSASSNSIAGSYATIGGGVGNTIGEHAHRSVIGGGSTNVISTNAFGAVIGGGENNAIGSTAGLSTIGGGGRNLVDRGSVVSTIAGGRDNSITGDYAFGGLLLPSFPNAATIGGGIYNRVDGKSLTPTIGGGGWNSALWSDGGAIPGGFSNQVAGFCSLAAGQQAQAVHGGSFVWADASVDQAFCSTDFNQFLIRAAGGVGINNDAPGAALDVAGTARATRFEGEGSLLVNLNPANLASGTVTNAIQFAPTSGSPFGVASSNHVTHLNSDWLDGLDSTAFWKIGGNSGTAAGTHFLGTTDNQPLQFHVNSQAVLRLIPGANSDPSIIAGSPLNIVAPDAMGATIGGGFRNDIQSGATYATIAGGANNLAAKPSAAVGGGDQNVASGRWATVPGGLDNAASADFSFAAGRRSKASHAGAFVWGDSTDDDFGSTQPDQFLIRAVGGVGIGTSTPAAMLDVGGVARFEAIRVADSAVVTNLNADLLDGLNSTDYWKLGGNQVADPAAQFVGVINNQPLEFRVNNLRALRLEPANQAAPNIIAGHHANAVAGAVVGVTIAGGGADPVHVPPFLGIGGGGSNPNVVASDYGVIGGGAGQVIQADSLASVIGGGAANLIASGSQGATISGGWLHSIASDAPHATIGGGSNQVVQAGAMGSTIAGGWVNKVEANARSATIGGGFDNIIGSDAGVTTISGGGDNWIGAYATGATIGGGGRNTVLDGASYSTVPGGLDNQAGGHYSFAAGRRAKARHQGSFVWADSQYLDFASTADNQFLIRASGGVGIGGAPQDALLDIEGNARLNNFDLHLRHAADRNHGLGWYGSNYVAKGFAGVDVDGPVLYGWNGGALGATSAGNRIAVRWTADSRVGIGTPNPAVSLHVASPTGPASVLIGQDYQRGGYSALWMGVNAVSGGHAYLQGVKTAGVSYGDLALNASGGKVGIGTTSPQDALHIAQDQRAFLRLDGGLNNLTGLRLCETNGLRWTVFVNGTEDDDLEFHDDVGNRMTMVLQSGTGRVGIGRDPTANALEVGGDASKNAAGNWLANSDARIKTDVATVTNALDTLSRVRLVRFRYTDAYRAQHPDVADRPYLNVIAQEFREVFPEAVKSSGETLDDGAEILQVDTHPLTVYSAAAVQELAARVKQQDVEIHELRQAVATLTQRVYGSPE
jgi:hypothetical protein